MILSQSYSHYIQLLATALFRALIMEQEKLSLHFFLNMAWCMTLFRGALQLHFFGRNRAAQRLYIMRGRKKEKSVFAAAAMCFGHEISMFSRGLLNGPLRKIHFSNTERKHEWRKASLVLPLIGNANRQYD